MISCPQCGHVNPDGDAACGGCGARFAKAAVTRSQRLRLNPTAAMPCPEPLESSPFATPSPQKTSDRPPAIRLMLPQAAGPPRESTSPWPSAGSAVHAPPVAAAINFNHFLVHDCPTSVGFLIENHGKKPLTDIEIRLESRGLRDRVSIRLRELAPKRQHRWPYVDFHPWTPSSPPLHCRLSFTLGGKMFRYRGSAGIVVLEKPRDPENVSFVFGDIQSPKAGTGHNAGLGQVFGNVEIKNLLGEIHTLNQLLATRLPERFCPIDLALDYEISESAVSEMCEAGKGGLRIPNKFCQIHAPATKLDLVPNRAAAQLPGIREIHILARPEFRLGRDPELCDLHTSFLRGIARSNEDPQTLSKRLSKVHLTARLAPEGALLFDGSPNGSPSTNGSTLDGQPLHHGTGIPVTMAGQIVLAGVYVLNVAPCASSADAARVADALGTWTGRKSPKRKEPPVRGALRFQPSPEHPVDAETLWMFTDASWGSSEWNAVVTPHPALDEIHARFHHIRGCFWLEQCSETHPTILDGHALKPGEIAPLANGQSIRIGPLAFDLSTEP